MFSIWIIPLLPSPWGSTVKARGQLQDAFSSDGTYIVTAHHGESTVTVTNLDSPYPSPSQFIDTDLEILAMILTGNVLLVEGPDKFVAWLLTKEGMVDGIFGNTRAGRNDSLWDIPTDTPTARWLRSLMPRGEDSIRVLGFSAEGEAVAISLDGHNICVYDTRTGGGLIWTMVRGLDPLCFVFVTHTEMSAIYITAICSSTVDLSNMTGQFRKPLYWAGG
jgi:hypothetical protein